MRRAAIVGILLLLLAGLFFFTKTQESTPVAPPARIGPIPLAASSSVTGAMVWLAADKGFFEQAGVDVAITGFSFGKQATDALVKGDAVLATTAEYVVAKMAPKTPDLRIISTIAISHDIKLVAHPESGITGPATLAGKRIGITVGSNAEFLIDRLLTLNGVSPDNVIKVNLAPPAMADALEQRTVDAIMVWQPHAQAVAARLGGQALQFDGQPGQDYYTVLIGREAWLNKNPEAVKRVLQGVSQAEAWSRQHPAEFMQYLKQTKRIADTAEFDASNYRFSVGLSAALLATLSEERRWLNSQMNQKGDRQIDVFDLIAPAAMEAVAPQTVTVR